MINKQLKKVAKEIGSSMLGPQYPDSPDMKQLRKLRLKLIGVRKLVINCYYDQPEDMAEVVEAMARDLTDHIYVLNDALWLDEDGNNRDLTPNTRTKTQTVVNSDGELQKTKI